MSAAQELFLKMGYERTTLRDIASHAGLTTGSIYHNFEGKDDIFAMICETGVASLLRRLRTARGLAERRSPTERLMALFDAYASFFLEERGYYEIIGQIQANPDRLVIHPEKLAGVSAAATEIIALVAKVVREINPGWDEVTAKEHALLLIAFAEGLLECNRKRLFHLGGVTSGAVRDLMARQIERALTAG
jgi:AcrR family transcriptional regulator